MWRLLDRLGDWWHDFKLWQADRARWNAAKLSFPDADYLTVLTHHPIPQGERFTSIYILGSMPPDELKKKLREIYGSKPL